MLLTFLSSSAFGQTFENLSELRIPDTPSGPRSAGMGGIGFGDAAMNPAATVDYKQRVLALSAANVSYETFDFRNFGNNIYFSTREHISAADLTSAAFAIPIGRTVVSAYYRNEPTLRGNVPISLPSFLPAPFEPVACLNECGYVLAFSGRGFERRDRRVGVTAAFNVGTLSIGGGAELQDLNEESAVTRGVLGSQFVPQRVFRKASGRRAVPIVGARWHATPRIVMGASYKSGAEFDRTTSICRLGQLDLPACATETVELESSTQRMPHSIRAGGTVQLTRGLQLAVEGVHRNYSVQSNEPYGLFGVPEVLPYRDGIETHVGAEYRFTRFPLALRGGWWQDPARLSRPRLVIGAPFHDPVDHMTIGAGLMMAGLDVSFALDHTKDPGTRRATVGVTHSF